MADRPVLSLIDIKKSFGTTDVLSALSLDVARGEFLTLLGPSGCGKTTTLRIIAGLAAVDAGRVLLDGADVTLLPPEKRNVNTVFQHYALFPHMNIFGNIAYGLRIKGASKEIIRARVKEMLELVKLPGYEKRMPEQLSGGQQQRVAIARAVVNDPMLLLLDEPLGALDLNLRRAMQIELKALQKQLGMTFIYITHDQEEALNMSDRIAVMNEGSIEQLGRPDEIYEHPRTRYVATFIGQSNLFDGVISAAGGGIAHVDTGHGIIAVADKDGALKTGRRVLAGVRTERVRYESKASPYGFTLEGTVKERTYIAGLQRTVIDLKGGQEVLVTGFLPETALQPGQCAHVYWEPEHAFLLTDNVTNDAGGDAA